MLLAKLLSLRSILAMFYSFHSTPIIFWTPYFWRLWNNCIAGISITRPYGRITRRTRNHSKQQRLGKERKSTFTFKILDTKNEALIFSYHLEQFYGTFLLMWIIVYYFGVYFKGNPFEDIKYDLSSYFFIFLLLLLFLSLSFLLLMLMWF